MFHVVFSLASGLLYLGNIFQGFTRGILALRSLHIISSHLIPTISPLPPTPLLDAPTAFMDLPQTVFSPLPFEQRQSQAFSSSIPSYQSSLIVLMPSYLPNLVPVFITLAIVSGLVFFLPRFVYLSVNFVKTTSAFSHTSTNFVEFFRPQPISKSVPTSLLSQFIISLSLVSLVSLLSFWTGPVRTHISFRFINIDQIYSLLLRPSSSSSGSYPLSSYAGRPRASYVRFRCVRSVPASDARALLDCHHSGAVRPTGTARYSYSPYPGCDLRTDHTLRKWIR